MDDSEIENVLFEGKYKIILIGYFTGKCNFLFLYIFFQTHPFRDELPLFDSDSLDIRQCEGVRCLIS